MNHTHDHELTIGSVTKGLTLMRNKDGSTMYSVTENVPEYRDKTLFRQSNWTGGHGQYSTSDPVMYFDGQSIDTTQDGRILLGPLINQVYQTSALKDNYDGSDDEYGTVYGVVWKGQSFTAASSYTISSVSLEMYHTGNPGTVTVSIRATAAGVPTGGDLCSGTYNGNTLPTSAATAAWTNMSLGAGAALTSGTMYAIVVRAVDTSAGNQVYFSGDNTTPGYATGAYLQSSDSGVNWATAAGVDYNFKTYELASTELDSTPTCFFWASTAAKWLTADTAEIYFYSAGAWTEAATAVANVSAFAEYNGVIYAAVGTGAAYWYSTDGDTWTQTDLTDHHATAFLSAPNAAGTSNVLWKVITTNQLANTTDGTDKDTTGVQYSTPAYVGDTSNNITNIFLSADKLMIGRADNLYWYDSAGGVHAMMEDLKVSRNTQNFKYVVNWQGNTYFSLITGVWELSASGYLSNVGPLQDTGDIDKVGTVVGIASDINYLYVAMLEGTVTHIYKGRPGTNGWAWCPVVYLGTNQCTCIGIAQHSITDKRLWFGYGTHTGYVYISDNPTADDNARFAASGWLRMSYDYGTNPYWNRMAQSVTTETASCTANITVQPKYRKDSETSMTNLTAAITTNGVVKTNLTSALAANRFQYEVDLATNSSTATPQVRMLEVRGHEKPETFRVHECVYQAGDEPGHRSKTIRDFLRGGRTSTTLIKLADLRYKESVAGTAGTDYVYVIMEPGSPAEVEMIGEPGRQPEVGLKVRFREVNYT
jgi:hypothetical protein